MSISRLETFQAAFQGQAAGRVPAAAVAEKKMKLSRVAFRLPAAAEEKCGQSLKSSNLENREFPGGKQ